MAKLLFEGLDHAKLYSAFRPSPPKEIISRILSYIGPKLPLHHAVDVGCGTGQSTVALSPHFQRVTGVDISEAQIAEAIARRKQNNIEYTVAPAEELPVPNESVELVTTVASLHWFDHQKFFEEVKRILVPLGVLAAIVPRRFTPISENPEKNLMLGEFHKQVFVDFLNSYMAQEVHLARNEYKDLNFPFDDVQRECGIPTKFSGTAGDMAGYISSTSFYQQMKKLQPEKATDLMGLIQQRMKQILEVDDPLEDIPLNYNVEYFLILCRKPV